MLATLSDGRRRVVSIARYANWLGHFPSLHTRPRMFADRGVASGFGCRMIVLAGCSAVLAGCAGAGGKPISASLTASRFDGVAAGKITAPEFALDDQDGRLVRLSAQRGKYVLITFLYVHCPDVCPVIAGQLNQALRELGPARRSVRVLAVSVDPRGDSPAAVRHFIAVHRLLPQFLYLTGTTRTLERVWSGYHIASTPTGKGVVVGHTAIELLLDPKGKPRVLYDSHVTAAEVVHDLHALGLET